MVSKGRTAFSRSWLLRLVAGLGLLAPLRSLRAGNEPAAGRASCWLGAGFRAGDVTYRIGGNAVQNGQEIDLPDPLSELVFPLGVPVVEGGVSVPLDPALELYAQGWVSTGDPTEPVQDSDWLEGGDEVSVYSESEASVKAYALQAGLRAWVRVSGRTALYPVDMGGGLGVAWQSFSWEARHLDQWYPLEPDTPHVTDPGLVATYEAELALPYMEAAVRIASDRLRLLGSVGCAPTVWLRDRDDHVLRGILAESEAEGVGVLGSLAAVCDLTSALFLTVRLDFLAFLATGTEKDVTYAGPKAGSVWEIDHDVRSAQVASAVGLGVRF
jgi:hypothetical protein